MSQSTPPALAVQAVTPADCRHSREPFDTLFRCIAERRDISPTAKLVHGRLVSQHRLGASWTQTEIGEALGLSRHQVWRAMAELISAGLLLTIRYGLGRPNGYVLLQIDEADLSGSASRRPTGQQAAGQPPSRARDPLRKEQMKNVERQRDPADYRQTRRGDVLPRR